VARAGTDATDGALPSGALPLGALPLGALPSDAVPSGGLPSGMARASVVLAARMPRSLFERPAEQVAAGLLGAVIEHDTADGLVAVALTEVEAYAGAADPASHAYRGRTRRNEVMFGPPGHAYVYFTYGMHFCVNLVCLAEGTAAAVLLRAGRVIAGESLARTRRLARPGGVGGGRSRGGRATTDRVAADGAVWGEPGGDSAASGGAAEKAAGVPGGSRTRDRDLARGPARLCRALAIDAACNGADVCDPASRLRIRAGEPVPRQAIRAGPRTGIRDAADVPWRFWVADDVTVSPYRAHPAHTGPGRR
jgi:DNA-3-methyladenine glycosylase